MTTSTSPVTSAPGQGPAWHTLSIEDALRKQGVDAATGLSQAEAESRLKQYGPNAFTAEKKESDFVAFLRTPVQQLAAAPGSACASVPGGCGRACLDACGTLSSRNLWWGARSCAQ